MKSYAKIIAIIIASALVSSGITSGVFTYLNYLPKGEGGRDGENKPPSLSGLPNITLSEDFQQLDAFNLSDYSSDPEEILSL